MYSEARPANEPKGKLRAGPAAETQVIPECACTFGYVSEEASECGYTRNVEKRYATETDKVKEAFRHCNWDFCVRRGGCVQFCCPGCCASDL